MTAKSRSKADTKHKHAEEPLHDCKDRFSVLADDAPVLIWSCDPDGCQYVNRAYLEFLGVGSQVDVQHFNWVQYVYPGDRETYLNEYLDSFRRRAPFNAVFRFRRHDGVYRWMKTVGQPRYTSSGEFSGFVGSTQDITDVKTMEDELRRARDNLESEVEQRTRALRESEEKYRRIVETASEGIWILDRNDMTSFVNPAITHMLGFAQQEIIGKTPFDFIDDTYREKVRDHLRSRREGAEEQYVCKYRRKDGGEVWAIITANTIYNDGEYSGAFAMVTDITERKRAEDTLCQNEKFLNNIFNCIQDGLSVMSKDLDLIRYNPTIEKWHGKDLLGKKCYKLFHGRDEPCENCPSVRAMREKTMRKEVVLDLKGWKEIYAYPLINDDGEVYGTVEQVRDITERKQADEALLKLSTSLAKSQEIAHLGSWELDLADNRLTWSDEVYRIFGLRPREFGATYEAFLNAVHPDDRAAVDNAYTGSLRDGKDSYEIEHRVVRKSDGEVRTVHEKCQHFRDERGNIIRSMGMVHDITERKRSEEASREAKAHAELYLDLMGHDINNMHQIALGYLELAQGMPPGVQLDEMIGKSIEVLQRSSRLIRNVRKLQKLNEGFLQTHEVDLVGMLHDVQREFGAVPGKKVTLSLNGNRHCYVHANELLHDIFANLVSNAIKHTGDSADITVNFDLVDGNSGNICRVSVEDDGPGIPDDFKGVIFNRVLKGTNKAKGMGLGLYLVKSLVESYGGRVWVEDRVKGDHTKGARFVVVLPAVGK